LEETGRTEEVSSPTQRTLAEMRRRGYLADVTERWIPGANVRRDLFGVIDVLCVGEHEVVGVQATSGDNVAARITKITEHPNLAAIRKGGIRLLVHGWRKSKGRWKLREVDVS
jgi:hypothetical protein